MVSEQVELRGHLIDSLILPKVLDEILNYGGSFELLRVEIGQRRVDPSYARLRVEAPTVGELEHILNRIRQHGAEVLEEGDVALDGPPQDGVFPEGFYVTTNLQTFIRWRGEWIEVSPSRMDCAIAFDPATRVAYPVRFSQVLKGDLIVVGQRGVRVIPLQRSTPRSIFEFMASSVSSEKPKGAVIKEVAKQMEATKREGKKVLVVAGPAVVHTGAGPHVVKLIERGYVDLLFAGNALAVHDIEQALYGTSLGVYLDRGIPALEGHENHIRAINTICQMGGIKAAVEAGLLKSGIMHASITHKVDFLLAGSIRDDGPLPEVITDAMEAQELMAEKVEGVGLALMVASALHSIATGNLLPAQTKIVIADIDPSVVAKLVDRGSFQAIGLVTDAEPFLRELLTHLEG